MHLEHNSPTTELVFPSTYLTTACPFSQRHKGPYRGQSSNNGSYRGALSFNNRSHGSHGCYGRGRGPSHSFSPYTPRQVCQVCNKPGHTALTCYHKFDYLFQQDNLPNMQAFATSSSPPSTDVN